MSVGEKIYLSTYHVLYVSLWRWLNPRNDQTRLSINSYLRRPERINPLKVVVPKTVAKIWWTLVTRSFQPAWTKTFTHRRFSSLEIEEPPGFHRYLGISMSAPTWWQYGSITQVSSNVYHASSPDDIGFHESFRKKRAQPECSQMRWSARNTVPLRLFFSCQVWVPKGTWRWEIFCSTDFPMTHGMLLLETISKCQQASYLTRSVTLKALRSFWSSSKIRESRMMEYILVAQSWISPPPHCNTHLGSFTCRMPHLGGVTLADWNGQTYGCFFHIIFWSFKSYVIPPVSRKHMKHQSININQLIN